MEVQGDTGSALRRDNTHDSAAGRLPTTFALTGGPGGNISEGARDDRELCRMRGRV
jgi:hypothetical protein